MPFTLDHQSCRGKTCLLCLQKAKTNRVMTEHVKALIEQMALPHYRHYSDLPSLPNVVCEKCRVKLQKRKSGKEVTLTVPKLSKFMDFEYTGTVTVQI